VWTVGIGVHTCGTRTSPVGNLFRVRRRIADPRVKVLGHLTPLRGDGSDFACVTSTGWLESERPGTSGVLILAMHAEQRVGKRRGDGGTHAVARLTRTSQGTRV
jgi:hypothetical protein